MSMKALIVEEFGDSSKLKYSEVPKPEPAEGEVNKLVYFTFLPLRTVSVFASFMWGSAESYWRFQFLMIV